MELDRQAALEAHRARIQAELPQAMKEEREAKAQAWGLLGWLKKGRAGRPGMDLVKRLDLVNTMARNPGWSL